MLVTLLQFVSKILSAISVWYQWKYNRLHRSIYGLSYDLYLMTICGHLCSIWCTFNYKYSSLVKTQLSNRFPIYYREDSISNSGGRIPISSLLLVGDILNLVGTAWVLKQFMLFKQTKHIHQGFSALLITILCVFSAFNIFTLVCSLANLPENNSGKFGIFYLEHINYIWVIGNIFQSFKIVPQLSINWMGRSVLGLSSKYVVTAFISALLMVFTSIYDMNSPTNYYFKPYNYQPIFVTILQCFFLIIILLQAQYWYIKSKPYLPKSYTAAIV